MDVLGSIPSSHYLNPKRQTILICSDCNRLISNLHARNLSRSHTHKNIIEVLRTAPNCDLCNLIISVEFKWEDNDEPKTSSISLYNTEEDMCYLEAIAKENPELFPAIKVSALQDVCTRTSSIVLEVRFISNRLGRIYLAVWKDTPCADLDTECGRHKKDFSSDHMFKTNPAENRWAQFRPCSTSDIAYRPYGMLSDDDSATTLDYLESWLKTCEWKGHPACTKSLAGKWIDGFYPWKSGALLPRRVLDVDTDLIRLVETELDDTGYYIALSHCWGRPESHPPKTTRANFENRLAGIPLSTLPKTFQDAVKITRHMGVRYLWIDSLCIVQDDEADWKREAANMGAIYEYARLTIAAAGARDCTEGCFVSERPDLRDVRDRVVKSTETQRIVEGNDDEKHRRVQRTSPPDPPRVTVLSKGRNDLPVTIHLAAVPWVLDEPYYSPLGYRAWARQEWYLSRRIIFFTQGGISWKCRSTQFDERERYYDMGEKQEWEHLLQRYSDDELTYETDRLVALQGVATQMASIMDGTYHFGFWTHMPELLFWVMRGPQGDAKVPDAPSWSWASRNGSKFFWKTIVQFRLRIDQENLMQNGIQVDEAGTLTTTAPILELPTIPVPDEWIAAEIIPWQCNMLPESALLYYSHSTGRPVLFLFDPGCPGNRAIGLAGLDDDSGLSSGKVFCIYLLSTHRLEVLDRVLQLCPHGDTRDTGPEQPFILVKNNTSYQAADLLPKSISKEGFSDYLPMLQHVHFGSPGESGEVDESTTFYPTGNHLYWVLLVQEVIGRRITFVGLAWVLCVLLLSKYSRRSRRLRLYNVYTDTHFLCLCRSPACLKGTQENKGNSDYCYGISQIEHCLQRMSGRADAV